MEEKAIRFFSKVIARLTLACTLTMLMALIILIISVITISQTSGIAVMLNNTNDEIRRIKTLGERIEFNLEQADSRIERLREDINQEKDLFEDALKKAKSIWQAIRNLEHEDPSKRTEAAFIIKAHGAEFMLGDYGEDARREAVDGLIKNLEDEDWEARTSAAHALGLVRDKKAVPLLMNLLEKEDENPITKTIAAHALGNYGTDAQPAFDALVKLLEHNNWEIREAAVSSLSWLKDKRAIPFITKMTEDENEEVRRAAKAGLENISLIEKLEGGKEEQEGK